QTFKSPIFDGEGKVCKLVAVIRDITDRKRAEEVIREGERRFQAIYDQAPTGIAVIDSLSGQFKNINQRYCDIVGYSQEEMLGQTFQDITCPEDLKADLDNMKRLLEGKAETFQMEKRYFRKDGKIIWVNLTCVPLWLERTDPRMHIAIVEDITERKKIEEQMREQRTLLRTLAVEVSVAEERERRRIAMVLHDDIGQSLAILKLKLGSLMKLHPAVKKTAAAVEINDLLAHIFSTTRTLTFGLVSPLLYELGLSEAIRNLVEQMEGRHPEMSIRVEMRQELPTLTDEVSIILFRIFRELLFNIEKHAQARNVIIKIQVADNQLHLNLIDDGVGFKTAETEKGFTATGGFGLFSIEEQLKGIGGDLTIDSSPGKGTHIGLRVPLSSSKHNSI
ncbi:MAG: PAS domain S-box protein, partial [Nitrospirota bacterium]